MIFQFLLISLIISYYLIYHKIIGVGDRLGFGQTDNDEVVKSSLPIREESYNNNNKNKKSKQSLPDKAVSGRPDDAAAAAAAAAAVIKTNAEDERKQLLANKKAAKSAIKMWVQNFQKIHGREPGGLLVALCTSTSFSLSLFFSSSLFLSFSLFLFLSFSLSLSLILFFSFSLFLFFSFSSSLSFFFSPHGIHFSCISLTNGRASNCVACMNFS
jgi:hypothetical protein